MGKGLFGSSVTLAVCVKPSRGLGVRAQGWGPSGGHPANSPASRERVPTLYEAGLAHDAEISDPRSRWLTQQRFISGSYDSSTAGSLVEEGGPAHQSLLGTWAGRGAPSEAGSCLAPRLLKFLPANDPHLCS